MNQFMGAGEGGLGGQHGFPLEAWFWEMPVCTRIWTSAVVLVSLLTQCDIVSEYKLYYNPKMVFERHQWWRLATNFVYFGPMSLDLIFHVFFLQRYSRLLEESAGRSPAYFSWLLLYACTSLLLISPLVTQPYLGHALSSTLVYIWSRRNPDVRLSIFGLIAITAPWLPWVLMGFAFVMQGSVPKDEILGVVVGHVWYFFSDVFPPLHGGYKPLDPPMWWRRLFEGRQHRQEIVAEETAEEIDVPPARQAPAPEVL